VSGSVAGKTRGREAGELFAARSFQLFHLREAVIHGAIGLSSPHVDWLMT
jgi:hypothetical protein